MTSIDVIPRPRLPDHEDAGADERADDDGMMGTTAAEGRNPLQEAEARFAFLTESSCHGVRRISID